MKCKNVIQDKFRGDTMKKLCPVCNEIVEGTHNHKLQRQYNNKYKRISQADRFRNTQAWQKKRKYIYERDRGMCRVCINNGKYNFKNISVHHIEPLAEHYDKRLDDNNLICLCSICHELAESGAISAEYLKKLVPPPTF